MVLRSDHMPAAIIKQFRDDWMPETLKLSKHRCELTLRRFSGGYNCNSGHENCANGQRRLNFRERPSFRCQACDFDCCLDCARVELAEKGFVELMMKDADSFDWNMFFALPDKI